LAHAYFNAPHNEKCILMPAIVPKQLGSKEELLKVLKEISTNKKTTTNKVVVELSL